MWPCGLGLGAKELSLTYTTYIISWVSSINLGGKQSSIKKGILFSNDQYEVLESLHKVLKQWCLLPKNETNEVETAQNEKDLGAKNGKVNKRRCHGKCLNKTMK